MAASARSVGREELIFEQRDRRPQEADRESKKKVWFCVNKCFLLKLTEARFADIHVAFRWDMRSCSSNNNSSDAPAAHAFVQKTMKQN